jgi:hypothetical protein
MSDSSVLIDFCELALQRVIFVLAGALVDAITDNLAADARFWPSQTRLWSQSRGSMSG